MPWGRDVIVPDMVDGIEEVIIKHTKTKCGTVRTTEKVVPVLRPRMELPSPSIQSSQSKKKGMQAQSEPQNTVGSGKPVQTLDNIQVHPYLDEQGYEQGYDLPDTAEDSQPQATPQTTVCITFHLHGMTLLIRRRPQ